MFTSIYKSERGTKNRGHAIYVICYRMMIDEHSDGGREGNWKGI